MAAASCVLPRSSCPLHFGQVLAAVPGVAGPQAQAVLRLRLARQNCCHADGFAPCCRLHHVLLKVAPAQLPHGKPCGCSPLRLCGGKTTMAAGEDVLALLREDSLQAKGHRKWWLRHALRAPTLLTWDVVHGVTHTCCWHARLASQTRYMATEPLCEIAAMNARCDGSSCPCNVHTQCPLHGCWAAVAADGGPADRHARGCWACTISSRVLRTALFNPNCILNCPQSKQYLDFVHNSRANLGHCTSILLDCHQSLPEMHQDMESAGAMRFMRCFARATARHSLVRHWSAVWAVACHGHCLAVLGHCCPYHRIG